MTKNQLKSRYGRDVWIGLAIAMILVVISLPSCKHDPVGGGPVDPIDTTGMAGNSCDPDTIYFTKDVMPILLSSCGMALCHDDITKSGDIQITSYETLIESDILVPGDPDDSEMYQRMSSTDPFEVMPPSPRGPISSINIETVRKWIEQGALNNDCKVDTTCNIPGTVSFANDVFPVIDKYCVGCHSGGNPLAGLFLKTYDDVKKVADNGKLVGVIDHEMGFPPMPKNMPKLMDCKIETIRQWVDSGAPNN